LPPDRAAVFAASVLVGATAAGFVSRGVAGAVASVRLEAVGEESALASGAGARAPASRAGASSWLTTVLVLLAGATSSPATGMNFFASTAPAPTITTRMAAQPRRRIRCIRRSAADSLSGTSSTGGGSFHGSHLEGAAAGCGRGVGSRRAAGSG
jgi:hypothetical protein